MILEAAHFAVSYPLAPKAFRPYLKSSISLWSRARRCRESWQPHELLCHQAIAGAVLRLKSRRTCVVLGSGLLYDVPIEFLSRQFDTVILFDLAHPASVHFRLFRKRLKNVRLMHRDLSGLDDLKAGRSPEPLAFLKSVPYLDFVVSANLLSQIGIGARRLAVEAIAPDAIRTLLEAHVEGLKALSAPCLLMTDTHFDILDLNGTVQDQSDLMHGLQLPEPDARWQWMVAPVGEISKTYALTHHVTATLINPPGRP